MKIIITGGAGFLGSLVATELLRAADAGQAPIPFDEILSVDLAPCPVQDERVTSLVGDLASPDVLREAVTAEVVGIFHLAAVLSGGSEADFDLAMRVNVDGTRALLEAARAAGSAPRFVFTSSLAVFGGNVPEVVPETWAAQPDSTYGAAKAMGELLVNEYSRRGWVDARICRLPTISVRPGVPNSAASSFASGIIREPLAGVESVCPVPHETRMWLSSPEAAVRNLVFALGVPGEALGAWRGINIPGISVTVGEMLAALDEVGGPDARALVRDERDPAVEGIVCSWPGEFEVQRLLDAGFTRDEDFLSVVRRYADGLAAR
ncbi:D-erythronate dehydrogenase [Falsarthrobacter nasiphocae]|uniref:Nucleoside-diphosphate-sugar epimerase n=1 Tax=Falsarthrobacter nasiphocae TaxID=189863 RepID=A0AAE3YG32_9MICC|nr:D-erythronate dehydrogenase [Falsarthrobacter nasiphocae]MDR6892127.1 nucleoside-diphosphate-sugar epimerase [Falsarthrobacter nasiphocae]